MNPIFCAVFYLTIITTNAVSINYSSALSDSRNYEYPSYLRSRAIYDTSNSYSSPYSKSDTNIYQSDSSNDGSGNSISNDARTAYYKNKFASEALANSLRPSPPVSSDTIGTNEFPSSAQSIEYSTSASYSVGGYGNQLSNQQRPESSSLTGSGSSPSEYSGSRPSNTVYGGYANNQGVIEYPQRPPASAYSHSGHVSPGEYSSPHHHHYSGDYMMPAQHHYKTYTQSVPKYQSILGALKSLFGGGDSTPSPSHYPVYYSPSSHLHHGSYSSASGPVGAASAPAYFYSGASGHSSSPYSKNYISMPMRYMPSGYSSGGNKIVVVRDSASSHSSLNPSMLSPSSSYPSAAQRSRYYSFSPQNGPSPSYISSVPNNLNYASGPPANAYPSGSSFSSGHHTNNGGSPFLGYSS